MPNRRAPSASARRVTRCFSTRDWSASGSLADRFRAVPRGVAGEDREAAEEPPLAAVEQVRRPLRGRAQRALTGVRARAAVQQVEPLAQPRQQLRRREHGRARSRQLERQRQAVEAPAELGHLGGRHEAGVHAARPLDIELDGILLAERRHGIGAGLAAQPEAFAARHQQRRAVDRAQLVDRAGRRSQHVLRVVDEQQDAPAAQPLRQRARPGGCIQRDGTRDLPGDLRRVAHRGEGHEVHAVGERVSHLGGSLERQVRLADAAGPGQREQAGAVSQRRNHRGELAVPSHERRGRLRERARCGTAGQGGRRRWVDPHRDRLAGARCRCSARSAAEGSMPSPSTRARRALAIGLQRLGLPAVRGRARASAAPCSRSRSGCSPISPAQLTDPPRA